MLHAFYSVIPIFEYMGLEELKTRIHALVDDTTSEDRLRKAEQDLLGDGDIPYVDPAYEEGILRGLQQVKEGKMIPAEEMIARLRARRSRPSA